MVLLFLVEKSVMFDDSNKNCILLEPPKPIIEFIYLCDKRFHTELIKPLYQNYDKYGIIIIGGEEVKLYTICGTEIKKLDRDKIRITKNHNKGGQSAQRFGRIRDNEIQQYIAQCNELIREYYLENDLPIIKCLVIAGMADKKDKLYATIHQKLKDITHKITISDKDNIKSVIEKSKKIFNAKEKELKDLREFYDHIQKNTDRAIYGIKEVIETLENCCLQKILIHESFRDDIYVREDIKQKCKETNCQYIEIMSINCLTDEMYKGYGGIVGISWY